MSLTSIESQRHKPIDRQPGRWAAETETTNPGRSDAYQELNMMRCTSLRPTFSLMKLKLWRVIDWLRRLPAFLYRIPNDVMTSSLERQLIAGGSLLNRFAR